MTRIVITLPDDRASALQAEAQRRGITIEDLVRESAEAVAMKIVAPKAKRTLERALGIAKTDSPAPDDAQVKRWLEERRMEKYGGQTGETHANPV
jgi:hypothetical protein